MKTRLLLLFLLFFEISGFAQLDYKIESKKPGANYFEIVKNKRAYFKQAKKGTSKTSLSLKKQEKHFERWAYYWRDRVDSKGNFPNQNLGFFNAGILSKEGKIVKEGKQKTSQKLSLEAWSNIGPKENPVANGYDNFPQMGRLNSFLRIKHPTDRSKDILFVGAPSGGLWKSTDNGATWSAKLDIVAGIGITDIKTASTTNFNNYSTKPIYISTGDYDGVQVNSIGVLKSVDGGETFTSTNLNYSLIQGNLSGQMVVIDDDTVVVSDLRYIRKTTDGGVSWSNVYDSGDYFSNIGRVAVSGDKIMYTGYDNILFSKDAGETWSIPDTTTNSDKHAVTLGSDGKFYIQNTSGQIKTFDEDSNSFVDVGIIPGGYNAQGGYNQALIVKDGLIVSGEFNGQTSTDNGASWYRSLNGYYFSNGSGVDLDGTYIHSDHHGLGLLDGKYEFWSVNDGGLNFINYSSLTDKKPTIEYKSNGVIVTQLYTAAITPNSADGNYLMANQDNDGFSKEMHNGSMQWIAVVAGDGVAAAINYNSPGIRYLGGQNGGLRKASQGFSGNLYGNSFGVINGAGFVWPLEIHTTNPTILYAGGDDVYKIVDPSASADIKNSIDNAENLNSGAGRIIKINTHGDGIVVVGESATKLSKDSGKTWTTINNPSENIQINSVDFDQSNMNILYCTVSSYFEESKVFKSTDSGVTWANISSGLPNIVMKKVLLKQNQANAEFLFVATELGVYFKNGAKEWERLGKFLPNVIVNDIDINYAEDILVAATFGRGLWQVNINNSTLDTEKINLTKAELNVFPNPVTDGVLNITVNKNHSDFNYVIYNVLGGVVKEGVYKNQKIDISTLEKGFYVFKAFKNGVVFPEIKFLVTK